MPLMRWFPLVPIEKDYHTKKRCAGSTRPVALSLTLWSLSPSSPSRNQKCPRSSPPPARRFPQPCKHTPPHGKDRCCGIVIAQISMRYALEPAPKLSELQTRKRVVDSLSIADFESQRMGRVFVSEKVVAANLWKGTRGLQRAARFSNAM